MKTKTEIINETFEAYKDVRNRAEDVASLRCVIQTTDGRKCAIGRVMTDEAAARLINKSGSIPPETDFKPDYRGHESRFWIDIRTMHDVSTSLEELTKQRDNLLETYKEQ